MNEKFEDNWIERCRVCKFVFKKVTNHPFDAGYKVFEDRICKKCANTKTKDVKHGTTKASL